MSNLSHNKTFKSIIDHKATGLHSAVHYVEDARSGRFITYQSLADIARTWQSYFKSSHSTNRVLLSINDPLSFTAVHLSLLYAGIISIPVDPSASYEYLEAISHRMDGLVHVVSDHETKLPNNLKLTLVNKDSFLPINQIEGQLNASNESFLRSGSIILFTSGSTGAPKGVELPEAQLLYVAGKIADHNQLSSGDRGYNSLPLFHVNAQVVGLLATLISGATLVLDEKFHKTDFWDLMEERGITWINAVPAILAILARSGEIRLPSTLRFIRSASAPLPEAIRVALGNIPLVISYGMTEGASQITATPLDTQLRPGSVGVPIGCALEIRDEEQNRLPFGDVGAIWLKGPGIISHYLSGQAEDRFDSDGWLRTGDLGRVDEDGYVYMAGRSDDVINRGGEMVYPADIEEIILQDVRVTEVVVAARPDELLHQVPIAYVIRSDDRVDSDEELIRDIVLRCQKDLPKFKQPVAIHIVNDLPRAATGKVQRVKVREMALAHGDLV